MTEPGTVTPSPGAPLSTGDIGAGAQPWRTPPVAAAPAAAAPAGDAVTTATKVGAVPGPGKPGSVDWGRMGIAAALAPVAYVGGVYEHELGGHGLMALALGGHDITVDPLPHTYTRSDGSTGFRFAEMSYQYGPGWTPAKTAAVDLAPSMVDTGVLGLTTTLYETGNWPTNPWASGALFVWHAAAIADLANAAQGALIHPENTNADTAHASAIMGVNPRVLGAVEAGLAVAGTVEAVRIGLDVFSKHPTPPDPTKPHVDLVASPSFVGVSGTF